MNITEQKYIEICDDFKERIKDKNKIIHELDNRVITQLQAIKDKNLVIMHQKAKIEELKESIKGMLIFM